MLTVGVLMNLVYILRFMDVKNDDGTKAVMENGMTVERITMNYLRYLTPYGYLDFTVDILNRYLINQNENKPVYFLSTLFVALSVSLHYTFVTVLDLKEVGICLAIYLSRFPVLICSLTYCIVNIRRGKLGWEGFSKNVFYGWPEMMKLGASGSMTSIAEVGLFEVAIFVSNFAGLATLSTVLITIQVDMIIFGIKLGITYTAAIMIGNALGEGILSKVKASICVSVFNCLATGIPLSILAFVFREQIAGVFTDDPETIAMYSAAAWIMLINNPLDSILTVVSRGILTAMGKQSFNAIALSIVSYGISLPLIVLLTFYTDLRAKGIFAGILSFSVCFSFALLVRLYFVNLNDEIALTKERLRKNTISKDSTQREIEMSTVIENTATTNGINGTHKNASNDEAVQNLDNNDDSTNSKDENSENGEKVKKVVPIRKILFSFAFALIWMSTLTGVSFIKKVV